MNKKEYIERDYVLRSLTADHHPWSAYEDSYEIVQNAPAAEVVPRSEIDKARQQGYESGKREVARKICCEIETEIVAALKSNYKAKAEREAHPIIDMADEFVGYCEGKIAALRGIDDFIEELKTTYMVGGE